MPTIHVLPASLHKEVLHSFTKSLRFLFSLPQVGGHFKALQETISLLPVNTCSSPWQYPYPGDQFAYFIVCQHLEQGLCPAGHCTQALRKAFEWKRQYTEILSVNSVHSVSRDTKLQLRTAKDQGDRPSCQETVQRLHKGNSHPSGQGGRTDRTRF